MAVAEQVAEALAHAHSTGVVHRDVKPSNILFDEHGHVRLADFGIARLAGTPSLTGTGQLIGSLPYLAPEQVEGGPVGPPADIYALGLVVIECLTGHPCYPGAQIDAAMARLHRPPAVPGGTPQWLGALLTAMTERAPGAAPRRTPGRGPCAAATSSPSWRPRRPWPHPQATPRCSRSPCHRPRPAGGTVVQRLRQRRWPWPCSPWPPGRPAATRTSPPHPPSRRRLSRPRPTATTPPRRPATRTTRATRTATAARGTGAQRAPSGMMDRRRAAMMREWNERRWLRGSGSWRGRAGTTAACTSRTWGRSRS